MLRRRLLAALTVLALMLNWAALAPPAASAESIFTKTTGFATKTGFRFVFAWEATQPIVPQVEYGTDPNNLNQLATPIPPGIPDTGGLALADDRGLVGQTIHWRVRDLLTDEVSETKNFEAKNAYTAWDSVEEIYTVNLLVQLDSQSLPPELTPDLALQDIAEGMNVFAERMYDMLDGHARVGEVLITDTTTDYNGALPFVVNSGLDECVPATTNVADVIVSTAEPFASQTFTWAIDDPCQAFVVGREGQLVDPWRDDLHLGAVSAHEMGHYAFGAPDLYIIAPTDTADCFNAEWDGSIMHNTGGYSGSRWYLTELDRNSVTTPCNHGDEPYSWDVLRTEYEHVPPAPATGTVGFGIDHIIDVLARGNEDGDALNICILDREPGASSYECIVPDDGQAPPPGNPCKEPGQFIMNDPEGDSAFGLAAGRPEHDIRELRISEPNALGAGKVVFTLKMTGMANPTPNTTWPVQFKDQNNADRWVRMQTSAAGVVSFGSGTGTAYTGTAGLVPADSASNYNVDGTIRIVVARANIGNPVPGNQLTAFLTRIQVGLPTPDNMPDSLARVGSYTILGSENCSAADNNPPVAVDDSASTAEDTSVTVAVLANDSDPDGDTVSLSSVGTPANGSATNNGDGTVTYDPNANFNGTDTFTYTIGDGRGGSDTGTVTVTVSPTGDPPQAFDDSATTAENTSVTVNVLANDHDPDGDPLSVTGATNPPNGSAVVNPDKTITYTPDSGFAGIDSFDYTISDGTGGSDTATVTIQVSGGCFGPAFTEDLEGPIAEWTFETPENSNVGLNWGVVPDPFTHSLTNAFFSDAAGVDLKDDRLISPPLRISTNTRLTFWHRFFFEPSFDGGVLEVTSDGGATWQDIAAAGGSFVSGGYNGTIDPAFGSPIAGRASWTGFSEFINAMTEVEVDLTAFAGSEIRLRWRLAQDPFVQGSIPGAGWWVDDIEVSPLLVDCPNSPPSAIDDTASTPEDTPVTVAVLANDSDADGDTLTVTQVGTPSNGTATTNGTTVTYSPNPNFSGTDSFNYAISDGEFTSTAQVTVTVAPANDGPDANNDNGSTDEDTAVTVNVLANDTDTDGDTLTITSASDPANGRVVNNGTSIEYISDPNFHGNDSFTYTISDGQGGSDTAVVSMIVRSVDDRPDARDDSAETTKNQPVTITVLVNDSDADGDSLTVTSVTDPAHGTATINPDRTVTYTPDPGYTGGDSFQYDACDPGGLCDTATVSIVVAQKAHKEK